MMDHGRSAVDFLAGAMFGAALGISFATLLFTFHGRGPAAGPVSENYMEPPPEAIDNLKRWTPAGPDESEQL